MKSERKTKKNSSGCESTATQVKGKISVRIAEKERLVVEARKFNFLSNVFMSVALDDKDVYIIYISETDLWEAGRTSTLLH